MEKKPLIDLSDKGRKGHGKKLAYEVAYVCTPKGLNDPGPEDFTVCARFRAYGDAFKFANNLRESPDPLAVYIR